MTRSVALFALASLAASVTSQTRPEHTSKAPLSAAEQEEALNTVREYARKYTASLPNYTCTQSTRQVITRPAPLRGGNPGLPLRIDLIEEQLSFVNGRELRKITKINDRRPSDSELAHIETLSHGEFGNLLDTIFDPRTGAAIRWERAATMNGRRIYVFAYRVPQSKGYALLWSRGQIRVPFEGFVYADSLTGAVVRIEMKCTEIPPNSAYRTLNLTLNYKVTKVASQTFLLPSTFSMRYEMVGEGAIVGAEYKSYRRFSTDSTITFSAESNQVAAPEPPAQAAQAPDSVAVVAEAAPAEEKPDVNTVSAAGPPAEALPVALAPPPVIAAPVEAKAVIPELPAAAVPAMPDAIFRTSTRLVQVSVIAQDKDGKPVSDLRRDEFQIFDNGAAQEIRLFLADRPEPSAPAAPAAGVYTNRIASGGSSVILFDKLFVDNDNSVFKFNVRARQKALQALNAIPRNDRIAIYALGCRFQVVREFTPDRDSLLEKLNAFAPGSAPCADSRIPGNESRFGTPDQAAVKAQMQTHEQEGFNEIVARRQSDLGESEFQAMADHLAGIPGRKNLIWVTSQFRLSPANVQKLIDANVAIYPVDAMGSMIGTPADKKARYAPLDAVAAMTGGLAFYGRDDFDAGIREAMRDGLVSYTLGFYPNGEDANAATHRLAVRVSRPGASLRYRTSYQQTPQAPASASPVDDLVQAINRPVDATVIPITARATRNGDRLDLVVSLDVPSLELELSDGLWKGKAELVTRFETAEGLPAGSVSAQTLTFNFRAATYDSMLRDGGTYPSRSELAIPANAVELKVLIGNLASGKIGTLTIPLPDVPSAGN